MVCKFVLFGHFCWLLGYFCWLFGYFCWLFGYFCWLFAAGYSKFRPKPPCNCSCNCCMSIIYFNMAARGLLEAHCSYTATSTLSASFCPSPSLPSSPFLAPPTEQQESLPSVQPFTLSQQTLGHVEVAIPGSIPSSRPREAVRTQTRKQCIVVGCQELLVPTMWRSHMTLHAKGIFSGAIPNFWLEEQDVYCCASFHQLVANSRSSSHSQRCKGRALPTSNPVDTPSLVSCSQSEIQTFPLLRRCVSLPSQPYGLSQRNQDLHLLGFSQPQ